MTNERLKSIKKRAEELSSTGNILNRINVKKAIEENITIHEMSLLSVIFDLSIEDLTDFIFKVVS